MSAITNLNTHRSSLRTVSLTDVTIDPEVQRQEGVDQRRVDKMAASFDPDALGVLILSQRPNGVLVCLDGMHRRAAAIAAGHTTYVDAIVHIGLTIAEEASLFLLYNDKKDPSAISRFHARVVAQDPTAVEMHKIITQNGWRVANDDSNGVIAAITAVENVYTNGSGALKKGQHPELLDRVVSVITAAWEHDRDSVHQTILKGLGQLFSRFPEADNSKIVAELASTRPAVLLGRARTLADAQGGSHAAALAKIVTGMHNRKRRTNLLPEWVWVR